MSAKFVTHLASYRLLSSTHFPQLENMLGAFPRNQERRQGAPLAPYQLLETATCILGME